MSDLAESPASRAIRCLELFGGQPPHGLPQASGRLRDLLEESAALLLGQSLPVHLKGPDRVTRVHHSSSAPPRTGARPRLASRFLIPPPRRSETDSSGNSSPRPRLSAAAIPARRPFPPSARSPETGSRHFPGAPIRPAGRRATRRLLTGRR